MRGNGRSSRGSSDPQLVVYDEEVLAGQKHLFTLPDDVHYLNCAYMSPLPARVVEAGVAGIVRKTAPSQIHADDFFDDSNTLRRLFAHLINAPDPQRIAIIPAVSYGISTVARNTPLEAGQNIVVVHEQFPSDVYAWHEASHRRRVEVRTVKPPDRLPRGREWNARLLEAIDRQTAIVTVPPLHWADGTRFDLEAIGARARECDTAFIVDGTQAVGAMPFDVQRIQPDALICAGYKWLLGPYSIGVAYFGPRYDDGVPLEEGWIARMGSEDFRELVRYGRAGRPDRYLPSALRYDVGERSNFILVPMLVAGLEQVLEWNLDEVQAYCRSITRELFAEIDTIGFGAEDEAWRGAHLFGLHAPAHLDIAALSSQLQARGVAVSLRGGAIRVSPHVYNDADDVAVLLEVLRAQAKVGARR